MYGDFGYIWNPRESPILTGLYDYIYIYHTHISTYMLVGGLEHLDYFPHHIGNHHPN